MIDESPPGRGNRGGFSGGVSGTSCNQASGVVTEFQVINSIVIISIVECRDESPPGRENRGGFSGGVSGTSCNQASGVVTEIPSNYSHRYDMHCGVT